jgi:hypothetical protein
MHRFGHGDPRVVWCERFSAPVVTPGSRRFESGTRALLDEALFKLREGREDRKDEFTGRGRRINGTITQRAKADATFPQGRNQGDEMGHGATQPIQSPHQQHIPRL